MRNNSWGKKIFFLIAGCSWSSLIFTQISRGDLQQFLLNDKQVSNVEVTFMPGIKEFYTKLNYKPAWINTENTINRTILLNELRSAAAKGLEEKDYQFSFVESYRKGTASMHTMEDSLRAEIRFTDAAIHFYSDISYGNTKPQFGYNGIKYSPDCKNVAVLLAENISKNLLSHLVVQLSPALPEVVEIEKKIRWINTVMNDSNFREVNIKSAKVNSENKPLVKKLFQLGIINSEYENLSDSLIKQKVKEAQRQFNLLADGTLRSTALNELNTSLLIRWQQLKLSVNYYRWLYCLTQNQSVINVNIPAAYMKVYRNNKVVLEMRVIVGKKATMTPTLASTVDEVILYPYWHVPFSIATKELLPAIKRNPGYINAGNYQVLNGAGKIIDPYSINWNAFSTSYFPYTIRQSTGCDNALGLLKLNFYSPFGVYLHDTPNKGLFMTTKRFYSHGCMRMEKPMALGHLVLKKNTIAIDTLEQKGCLRNQSPIFVHADEHMPVIVWYNPVGVDSSGRVIFYDDVYEKLNLRN